MSATEQARALIEANAYMTLATADATGVPWASPVWFAHDAYERFIWVSRPQSRHSLNIAARPEVGAVIFDSSVPIGEGRAVYLEATAERVADDEMDAALETYSRRSREQGGRSWSPGDVEGEAALRLYRAVVATAYLLDDRDRRIAVELR